MFKKKSNKADPALEAKLQAKVVFSWTVDDVGTWVKAIGYSQYAPKFVKNAIGGNELVTLSGSDLRALGVGALGHQKAILAKIEAISQSSSSFKTDGNANTGADIRVTEGDMSSVDVDGMSDHTGSSSSVSAENRLLVAATFSGQARSLVMKRSYTFERVLEKLESAYNFAVEVYYQGRKVEDNLVWQEVVGAWAGVDSLEITVKREDPNTVHKAERSMLHGLADACFIIDTKGSILFFNIAAEDLFGYSPDELLGHNIKELTPPDVQSKHDQFLRRYLETGNAKVIGKGRQVQVIHKSGSLVSCWLSVTEQKKLSGRHTFMGTLHEIQSRETNASTAKFNILDAVQDACIVINTEGIIQFMNSRFEKLLGYGSDKLGRNVSTIMPEPYSSSHASFLRNYLKSGTPKIIGRGGRVVVAKHANESVVPVKLEVDEVVLENKRYFVGIMYPKDAKKSKTKSFVERTRAVVEALAVPAIVINDTGLVQAFNGRAANLFGWQPVDIIGKNIKLLMNDDDASRHDSYLSNHMRTGQTKIIGTFRDVMAKTKSGKLFSIKLSVSKSVDVNDANSVLFTATIAVN